MNTEIMHRDELLAAALAEMEAAEPAGLAKEDPFDCDVLAGDADHTLSMWKISWSTQASS
jgi:hypothetical protein